jgi:hypothetical protein
MIICNHLKVRETPPPDDAASPHTAQSDALGLDCAKELLLENSELRVSAIFCPQRIILLKQDVIIPSKNRHENIIICQGQSNEY